MLISFSPVRVAILYESGYLNPVIDRTAAFGCESALVVPIPLPLNSQASAAIVQRWEQQLGRRDLRLLADIPRRFPGRPHRVGISSLWS